jgi:hypothetical protein
MVMVEGGTGFRAAGEPSSGYIGGENLQKNQAPGHEQRNPEVAEKHNARDAYTLALKAIEQLFEEQHSRISTQREAALAAAENTNFEDYESISSAASRAALISWEADEQVLALKKRLDELHHERIVEPIMEIRRLSSSMEKHNKNRFRRRVGDSHLE